jgi:hypothetical protein
MIVESVRDIGCLAGSELWADPTADKALPARGNAVVVDAEKPGDSAFAATVPLQVVRIYQMLSVYPGLCS